jgi:hypothetical protein
VIKIVYYNLNLAPNIEKKSGGKDCHFFLLFRAKLILNCHIKMRIFYWSNSRGDEVKYNGNFLSVREV